VNSVCPAAINPTPVTNWPLWINWFYHAARPMSWLCTTPGQNMTCSIDINFT
jgi:hypothetical protein